MAAIDNEGEVLSWLEKAGGCGELEETYVVRKPRAKRPLFTPHCRHDRLDRHGKLEALATESERTPRGGTGRKSVGGASLRRGEKIAKEATTTRGQMTLVRAEEE